MRIVIDSPENSKTVDQDPYSLLISKIDKMKDKYSGERIILRWDQEDEYQFKNGFYIGASDDIKQNPLIIFLFDELEGKNEGKVFIRCKLSNTFNKANYYDLIFSRIECITLRLPYIYIPFVDSFEAECTVTDKLNVIMDAVVVKNHVTEVCCSMLSHMIAIFSLDD